MLTRALGGWLTQSRIQLDNHNSKVTSPISIQSKYRLVSWAVSCMCGLFALCFLYYGFVSVRLSHTGLAMAKASLGVSQHIRSLSILG